MTNNTKIFGGLILIGLALGAIYLFTRRSSAEVSQVYPVGINPGNSELISWRPVSRKENAEVSAQGEQHAPQAGMVRYKNSETRDIEWDLEHMLPKRITITRESLQLPN